MKMETTDDPGSGLCAPKALVDIWDFAGTVILHSQKCFVFRMTAQLHRLINYTTPEYPLSSNGLFRWYFG